MLFKVFLIVLLLGGSQSARGGGGSRGSSTSSRYTPRPSSSSGGWSRPSPSSSSSTNYGWKRPSPPSTSTNTGGSPSTNYGWQKPNSSPSSSSGVPAGVNNAWQMSHPGGTTAQKTAPPSTNSGWQRPNPAPAGTSSGGLPAGVNNAWQMSHPAGTTAQKTAPPSTNAGWQRPNTAPGGTNSAGLPAGVNNAWQLSPPAGSKAGSPTTNWQRPASPSGGTNTAQKPGGWQVPNTGAPSAPKAPSTGYGWQVPSKPNSAGAANYPKTSNPTHTVNQGSSNNWKNTNPYNTGPSTNWNSANTGKKYEKGYSKGYDQGYQRGIQQSTKINPAYYPQQNRFGYPGQGINAGYNAPTYGGLSLHGTPNNYGYTVSSAYGYNSYGSGGSNHDFAKGAIAGALGGYLLNSAIHSGTRNLFSSSPMSLGHASSPWGYSGAGYGSGYQYTKIEKSNNSVINNYYFNERPKENSSSPAQGKDPDHWVHCVAYDPMENITLTNPNCTCVYEIKTDNATNATYTSHYCTSVHGDQVEKTPVSDVEVFDYGLAVNNTLVPEKLKQMEEVKERIEAYRGLEKVLNMGSFVREI